MRQSEIAHALYICRGRAFDDPSQTVVKVFLWPRGKVLGAKSTDLPFYSAVLEMGGHLFVRGVYYFM